MNTDKMRKALEQIQQAKILIAEAEKALASIEGALQLVSIIDGKALYRVTDEITVTVSTKDMDKVIHPLKIKTHYGNTYVAHGKESLCRTLFGESLKPIDGDKYNFTRENRLPDPANNVAPSEKQEDLFI